MSSVTKDELYNKGFRYSKMYSDGELDCYSLRFPVLKYLSKMTVVECEVVVALQTGEVTFFVYNYGSNDVYAPFYDREFGRFATVKIIEVSIKRNLQRLGVKRADKKKNRGGKKK